MKSLSQFGSLAEFADGLGYGIGYRSPINPRNSKMNLWRGLKSIVSLPAELVWYWTQPYHFT